MKTYSSGDAEDMIKGILNSSLRPVEKLFLAIEWSLREHKPYELCQIKLTNIKRKVKSLVEHQISPNLRRQALKEAAVIFQTESETKLLSLLMALAYYAYMDAELVHDHEFRNAMLSKLSELGFTSSQVQRFNNKWTEFAGTQEDLFNRIFQKRSSKTN